MEKFFAAIQNVFKVPELRKRVFFTFAMLAIYRLGAHITAPGVNKVRLEQVWSEVSNTLLGILDIFSGGNFRTISVLALGVMPYITASIIMQLMPTLYPSLKKIQEEGEVGRQKMNQWTRYGTVGLCLVQSYFISTWLQTNGVLEPTWWMTVMTIVTLTTGTVFVMWLGEQITERGVGNGISFLIFAGILISLPDAASQVSASIGSGANAVQTLGVIFLIAVMVILTAVIVYIESARRNITINYASRRVGSQVYKGQESSLPLKFNMGGVIPIIFASSVLAMPQTLLTVIPYDPQNPDTWMSRIASFFQQFNGGDPWYNIVFIGLIVLFTFFYITIVFNTEDVADNLRKSGGFIPGIRPGGPTADYLNDVMTRLTTIGATYLALVVFIPQVILTGFNVGRLPFIGLALDNFFNSTPGLGWITTGLGYQIFFGGSSLLIIVAVAMDTISQIEAQLVMRNYEGFLGAGSRLRGRRN